MTSITPNLAASAMGRADARDPAAATAADSGPFVLNLCSSTTPMALAQTDLAELKRFTFFVSRRFEEGRERFRLHMGYFTTLAEAEEWLNVVREIYPGAWAGEAPGKKLRARAAAAAAAHSPTCYSVLNRALRYLTCHLPRRRLLPRALPLRIQRLLPARRRAQYRRVPLVRPPLLSRVPLS